MEQPGPTEAHAVAQPLGECGGEHENGLLGGGEGGHVEDGELCEVHELGFGSGRAGTYDRWVVVVSSTCECVGWQRNQGDDKEEEVGCVSVAPSAETETETETEMQSLGEQRERVTYRKRTGHVRQARDTPLQRTKHV